MAPKNLPKDYKPYQKKVYREYLHDAIKNDDNEDIQRLLYCGVDLELQDDTGKTALQVAAELDKEEIVKELLSHGADRDKNNSYINILYRELQSNQKVYYGNPDDFEINEYALKNPIKIRKNGKLHEQPLLLYAIENRDFSLLNKMLKLKPDMAIADRAGNNIFDYLKDLLEKSDKTSKFCKDFSSVIQKIYDALVSQLKQAMVSYNRTKIVKLTDLLMLAGEKDRGIRFDEILKKNNLGPKENHAIVRFDKILKRSLDNILNRYKIHRNYGSIITPKDNRTLLHLAAIFDDSELIEKYHFNEHDAFITNNDKDTALHIAVKYGNIKAATTLLKKYPKILNEKNSKQETALDIAIKENKIEIVNLIFANSGLEFAEINRSINPIELTTKAESAVVAFTEGDTPLHLAVKLGNSAAIEKIIQKYTDIAKIKNQDGDTALHLAVKLGNSAAIEKIIQKYTDIAKIKNQVDDTALDIAVDNQQTEVVYAILEQNDFYRNLCSDRNEEKISKLLNIKEAYQFVQNNDPQTFSSLSEESQHLACCIAILQEKEDLLFEIQEISPDIMINRYNHGLAKEFSPYDLKSFLKNSSNTKCIAGIKQALYYCLGIKYPEAADFAGLLDKISPLKESEVLEKADVKKPPKTSPAADHREQVTEADHLQRGYDLSQAKPPPQLVGGNTKKEVHFQTGYDPSQSKKPFEGIDNGFEGNIQTDIGLPMLGPDAIRNSCSKAHARFGGVRDDSPSTPAR